MKGLPILPTGYSLQLSWSHSRSLIKWEFYRAHDLHGRLDRGHCYWLITEPDGRARSISYADLPKRQRPSFEHFSAASTALSRVQEWIDAARGSRKSKSAEQRLGAAA